MATYDPALTPRRPLAKRWAWPPVGMPLRPPIKPRVPRYQPGTIGAIAMQRAVDIRLQAAKLEAPHGR